MNEWWTPMQGNMVGAIAGSAVGVLGGVLGTVAGMLAPKGRAPLFVMTVVAVMLGLGLGLVVLGAVALASGQPRHVWYGPLLAGFILTAVLAGVLPALRARYNEAGRRRIEAESLRSGGAPGQRSPGGAALALDLRYVAAVALAVCALTAGTAYALIARSVDGRAGGAPVGAGVESPNEFTLASGVRVRLNPIEGIPWVGIVTSYDAGFIDDPAGAPQLAHLVEHLRCTGATASYGPNESFDLLNGIGGANAETLAACTYYDIIVPAEELETALRVEVERLTSLRFDDADLAREALRCAAEVDAVAASEPPHLLKFGMMAMAQGWRHGLDHAAVRTGLERITAGDARTFLDIRCPPSEATLHISGDFDSAHVRRILEESAAGAMAVAPASTKDQSPDGRAVDWSAQPAIRRMTWDVDRSVVAIFCVPPRLAADRIALSLLSLNLSQRLARGAGSPGAAPICGMPMWPAAEMPFFIFANVPDGVTADEALDDLARVLDDARKQGASHVDRMILSTFFEGNFGEPRSSEQAVALMKQLRSTHGMSEVHAASAVLNQSVLVELTRRVITAGDQDAVHKTLRMSAEACTALLRRALAPEKRRAIILTPAAK